MKKYKKVIENWFLHLYFIIKAGKLNTISPTGMVTTVDGCVEGLIKDLLKTYRNKP